ncbi:MAG: bifunctional nicotinamidase/pyrazinamidase [Ktedonobacterales bacterium]
MSDALIVVDVQNDFCPGGALPVPDGDRVVPVLNTYLARADAAGVPIFASRDWHPARTTHFTEFGGRWPAHCVQDTPGAAFHPDLHLPATTRIITKGTGERDEGYSAFEGQLPDGRDLATALREAGVTRVFVGGLATDYCVRATVLAARQAGFEVTWLRDASRPVDMKPGDGARAQIEMMAAGACEGALQDFTPSR